MQTPPTVSDITWFAPRVKVPVGPAPTENTVEITSKPTGRTASFALSLQKEDAKPADAGVNAGPSIPHRNRFAVNRTAGNMPVYNPAPITADFAPQLTETKVEAGQRPGFGDLLDIVNPLQHIPLVGAAYRKVTGDEISSVAQFIGGFLYGGPIGGVAAMSDIAMREHTGQGFGDRAVAMAYGEPGFKMTPAAASAGRWATPERMAGTQPVWAAQDKAAPSAATPSGPLSPSTNFAMLLNGLSGTTPNIS